MQGSSSTRNIFLGILLVGVLGGGYYFFSNKSSSNLNSLGAVSGADAIAAGDEQALIDQLLKLKSLRLDEKIFSDPAFTSLKDFSQTIPPEPVGRANPFLPVGVGPSR